MFPGLFMRRSDLLGGAVAAITLVDRFAHTRRMTIRSRQSQFGAFSTPR